MLCLFEGSMDYDEVIGNLELRLEGKSSEIRRKYLQIAKDFLKRTKKEPDDLVDKDAELYIYRKRKTCKKNYRRFVYYALLSLYRAVRDDKKYEFNFDPMPQEESDHPVFTIEHVTSMFKKARMECYWDYLVMRLQYANGLGRTELAYLNEDSIFEVNDNWFARSLWNGKFRPRNTPMDDQTAEEILDYKYPVKVDKKALFVYPEGRVKRGDLVGKRISGQCITNLVTDYRKLCNINLPLGSSHGLRRAYSTHREQMAIERFGSSQRYEIDIDLGHRIKGVTGSYIVLTNKPKQEPEYSLDVRAKAYKATHPLALGVIKI